MYLPTGESVSAFARTKLVPPSPRRSRRRAQPLDSSGTGRRSAEEIHRVDPEMVEMMKATMMGGTVTGWGEDVRL